MESKIKIVCSLVAVLLLNLSGLFAQISAQESAKKLDVQLEQCLSCEDIERFSAKITNSTFTAVTENVPNLGVSDANHWFRFGILAPNQSPGYLHIPYANINYLDIYFLSENTVIKQVNSGTLVPFSEREHLHQDFVIKLPKSNYPLTVYIRLKNNSQLMFPISLSNEKQINEALHAKDLFLGIYVGIILVMLLYNLFIYLSTRDHNYAWYLLYLLSVGLTQLSLNGVMERYLFGESIFFSNYSVHLAGIFSGLAVTAFAYFFLNVKKYASWFRKALFFVAVAYSLALVLLIFGQPHLSYNLINGTAFIGVIILMIGAVSIAKKGFRPAKFFIVAWSFFILSIIVFVFKDLGVLPYNAYTVYALPFGSAIEVILLSFALADKINVLVAEKEASRLRELEALKANKKLITDQNVILESRVEERTHELSQANEELKAVLMNLKNAQTQLVNQEKMASLGQLTAGIAHEINNPINFVSSNVKPLKRDIEDILMIITKYASIESKEEFESKRTEINAYLKSIDYDYVLKEIDQLIGGIEEGASRTSEIVKGLKNFSRLDENVSKKADLHQGIDSTLLILLSGSKVKVSVEKDYDESLSEIECYPGKLNQVFSNLLSNAFDAMSENTSERSPKIIISTKSLREHVQISFKDNGPGMPKEVQDKIFEPFFTTKEVGEGTGLGLSIVFSIIEAHKGKISVKSAPQEGTEFIIVIPKQLEGR